MPASVRRTLWRDRRGNVATLTALSAPLALMMAALAVDAGALYAERRHVQHVADLAAIAAASDPERALQIAHAVLADNGLGHIGAMAAGGGAEESTRPDGSRSETIEVFTGSYSGDPALEVGRRFVAGAEPENAVRVRIVTAGTRHFAASFMDTPWISAESVASARAEAAFSVGSRLARLEGGLLNAVLGGLTGSSLSLTAMDYDALAGAEVQLLDVLDGAAIRLSPQVGSYDQLLDLPVSVGDIAAVLASVDGVEAGARAALGRLADGAGGDTVRLGQLLALGRIGPRAPGSGAIQGAPRLGAMELVMAAAQLSAANGRNQVALDLGAAVPGVLSARLTLAIGEPPQRAAWFSFDGEGAIVRTAQTRLLLEVEIGGPGGLLGSRIRLPIYVELASAEAQLAGVSCAGAHPDGLRVGIRARPGIATLRIADPDLGALPDFGRAPAYAPARLVSLPLVRVSASAQTSIANPNWTTLAFDADEVDRLAVKRVSTTSISQSLVATLLSDLRLDVQVAGLGLGLPGGLTGTMAGLLSTATPAIDSLLVGVLSTLGITLGEADIRVHGASCGRPVLVQ